MQTQKYSQSMQLKTALYLYITIFSLYLYITIFSISILNQMRGKKAVVTIMPKWLKDGHDSPIAHLIIFLFPGNNYKVMSNYKTRELHAVPTLVCQGHHFNYSFQSYAPCPATAPCHYEQVFQVWCWYLKYLSSNGLH